MDVLCNSVHTIERASACRRKKIEMSLRRSKVSCVSFSEMLC
jgi:hypothetical protein